MRKYKDSVILKEVSPFSEEEFALWAHKLPNDFCSNCSHMADFKYITNLVPRECQDLLGCIENNPSDIPKVRVRILLANNSRHFKNMKGQLEYVLLTLLVNMWQLINLTHQSSLNSTNCIFCIVTMWI